MDPITLSTLQFFLTFAPATILAILSVISGNKYEQLYFKIKHQKVSVMSPSTLYFMWKDIFTNNYNNAKLREAGQTLLIVSILADITILITVIYWIFNI